MSGTLYRVATPIGNLGDLSPRGVQTLQEADFIAAEDTRVSMKLLNHFDIKKPLVSYHEHNRAAAGQAILARLLAGETCALVTDAGTPAISDPGEDLVRLCGENGVTVQAIPGCCAAVCALAVSGLPTGRFTFEGFLSANKKERREALTRLAAEQRTMVFHEAPHKLRPTLADMLELLGDRPVALCRELTKLHEETIRTTLSGAVALYREKEPRGEYVLVVAGAPRPDAGGGRGHGAEPAAAGPADEGRRPPGGGGHRSLPQRAVSGGIARGVRQGLSADAGGAYDRLYKGARIFRRPPEAAVTGQEMRLLLLPENFLPQGDQQLDRGRGRYGDLPVLRHRFRHRGA